MKHFDCFILLLVLNCIQLGVSGYSEDDWMDPYEIRDWKNKDIGQSETCQCKTCNGHDAIGMLYFKKFIAALFNRKKLHYDMSSDIYQRSLLFTILPEQLAMLEQLNDPRDLDSILSEIFAKTRTPYGIDAKVMGIAALIWDILKDLVLLLRPSEVQFVLLLSVSILLGYFVYRRYSISVILIFTVCFFMFYGFVLTYLECNRKLDFDEMAKVIKPSLYSAISEYFNPKTPPKEKLKKLHYCDPDDVLKLYANGLLLKQLNFILEMCTSALNNIKDTLPFPCFLVALILITMLTIIYVGCNLIQAFNAVRDLMQRLSQQNKAPTKTSRVVAINEDIIRLESPKQKLLNKKSAVLNLEDKSQSTVSGVQEIVEDLAASNAYKKKKYTKHFKPCKNNSIIKAQRAETNEPTLNDVCIIVLILCIMLYLISNISINLLILPLR